MLCMYVFEYKYHIEKYSNFYQLFTLLDGKIIKQSKINFEFLDVCYTRACREILPLCFRMLGLFVVYLYEITLKIESLVVGYVLDLLHLTLLDMLYYAFNIINIVPRQSVTELEVDGGLSGAQT